MLWPPRLCRGIPSSSTDSPNANGVRCRGPLSLLSTKPIGRYHFPTDIGAREMASIDKFNEHCWKDVIPAADLELYAGWRRETFVGARPALLAIDLYDLVYRGRPHPPHELNARYPHSCRILAPRANPPHQPLPAGARRAGIPVFYCKPEAPPQNRPEGARSTRQALNVPP